MSYKNAWHDLAQRIRFMRTVEKGWFVLLLVMLTPLALKSLSIIKTPYPKQPSIFGIVVLVAIVLQLTTRVVADIRMNSFLCPRCAKPFLRIGILSRAPLYKIDNAAKRHTECRSCQLALWAEE